MILSLPDSETPEVFGMHENASITYRQQQTRILLDTIITMSNSGGGGSDEDAGANEREVMAATTAMMERLPEVAFELSRAHPSTFAKSKTGGINSLGVFCRQECEQFVNLIKVIRRSLYDVQRAFKGFHHNVSIARERICIFFIPQGSENVGRCWIPLFKTTP